MDCRTRLDTSTARGPECSDFRHIPVILELSMPAGQNRHKFLLDVLVGVWIGGHRFDPGDEGFVREGSWVRAKGNENVQSTVGRMIEGGQVTLEFSSCILYECFQNLRTQSTGGVNSARRDDDRKGAHSQRPHLTVHVAILELLPNSSRGFCSPSRL